MVNLYWCVVSRVYLERSLVIMYNTWQYVVISWILKYHSLFYNDQRVFASLVTFCSIAILMKAMTALLALDAPSTLDKNELN